MCSHAFMVHGPLPRMGSCGKNGRGMAASAEAVAVFSQ